MLELTTPEFCHQPLIERVAVQDIQSKSLIVSWISHKPSDVYGYKVRLFLSIEKSTKS